jgi:hypothetical protein
VGMIEVSTIMLISTSISVEAIDAVVEMIVSVTEMVTTTFVEAVLVTAGGGVARHEQADEIVSGGKLFTSVSSLEMETRPPIGSLRDGIDNADDTALFLLFFSTS